MVSPLMVSGPAFDATLIVVPEFKRHELPEALFVKPTAEVWPDNSESELPIVLPPIDLLMFIAAALALFPVPSKDTTSAVLVGAGLADQFVALIKRLSAPAPVQVPLVANADAAAKSATRIFNLKFVNFRFIRPQICGIKNKI